MRLANVVDGPERLFLSPVTSGGVPPAVKLSTGSSGTSFEVASQEAMTM
jgi:hypothetical protein